MNRAKSLDVPGVCVLCVCCVCNWYICTVVCTPHQCILCTEFANKDISHERIITQQIKSRIFKWQKKVSDCCQKKTTKTIEYTPIGVVVSPKLFEILFFFVCALIFSNIYLLHLLSCWTKKCVDQITAHVTHFDLWPAQFRAPFSIRWEGETY